MMKIWKLGCGNEVKGEGYILNLILYSFFRVFPIFDPREFNKQVQNYEMFL